MCTIARASGFPAYSSRAAARDTSAGNQSALERLAQQLYPELRRIALRYMRTEHQSLQNHFEFWKDADPYPAILRLAKAEYAKLR